MSLVKHPPCPPECDHSFEAEDDYGRCPTRAKAAFERQKEKAAAEARRRYDAYVAGTQHIVEPLSFEAWLQAEAEGDGP
jgi:hypothetical protein